MPIWRAVALDGGITFVITEITEQISVDVYIEKYIHISEQGSPGAHLYTRSSEDMGPNTSPSPLTPIPCIPHPTPLDPNSVM